MIYTLTVVIWSDAGAYFAGRAYGRRKLAPKISPGKSVEGAIGGVVAGTLGGPPRQGALRRLLAGALAPARLGGRAGLRRGDLDRRDRRGSGRVAAQARRRGQGHRHAAARLRRRARPHRLSAARHPRDVLSAALLRLPAGSAHRDRALRPAADAGDLDRRGPLPALARRRARRLRGARGARRDPRRRRGCAAGAGARRCRARGRDRARGAPRRDRVPHAGGRDGGRARALAPLRDDLQRHPRHRARAPDPRLRRAAAPRGSRGCATCCGAARSSSGARHASDAPTACTPSPPRSGSSCSSSSKRCAASRRASRRPLREAAVGKISGAVGTFAHLAPEVEEAVCRRLEIGFEPVATQVVQRDRHAALMSVLALIASSLEKFAVEFRHLARTEVREVEEEFGAGQKGSSAMPHKRNPWRFENVCGLARVMRGYAVGRDGEPGALARARHQQLLGRARDLSRRDDAARLHARNALPAWWRRWWSTRSACARTSSSARGLVFSGTLLLELTRKGLSREEAYALVQRHAMETWDHGGDFRERVLADPKITRGALQGGDRPRLQPRAGAAPRRRDLRAHARGVRSPMKALVHVTLKRDVLDPQGKAIQNACQSLGYAVGGERPAGQALRARARRRGRGRGPRRPARAVREAAREPGDRGLRDRGASSAGPELRSPPDPRRTRRTAARPRSQVLKMRWKRLALLPVGILVYALVAEAGLQLAAIFMQRATRAEMPVAWVTGNVRVLCLGDSNTYGVWLERNQAYPQQLEARVERAHPGAQARGAEPRRSRHQLLAPGPRAAGNARDIRPRHPDHPGRSQRLLDAAHSRSSDTPTAQPQAGFSRRHSLIYRLYYLFQRGRLSNTPEFIRDPNSSLARAGKHKVRVGDRAMSRWALRSAQPGSSERSACADLTGSNAAAARRAGAGGGDSSVSYRDDRSIAAKLRMCFANEIVAGLAERDDRYAAGRC